MRTFAQKPKATQQTASDKSTTLRRNDSGPSGHGNPMLHSQRAIGNQALLRPFEGSTNDVKGNSKTAIGHYGYDFSRIPINPLRQDIDRGVPMLCSRFLDWPSIDTTELEANAAADAVLWRAYNLSEVPELVDNPRERQDDWITPRVQPKIRIGAVDDPLEREADRTADAVMTDHAASWPSEFSQPVFSSKPTRQTMPESIAAEQAQSALVDSGRPLSASERSYFEPRFSTDLSGVRLHTGPSANAVARGIGARAFALGPDIAFASFTIAPRTLAHELAHFVQPKGSEPVLRREPDGDPDEIEMPAEYVGRSSLCAGRPCLSDEAIYADLGRSQAEDAAAEARATAERKRRQEVERHGTKQAKWAIEFEEDPRISKNIGAVAGTRDDGTTTANGVRVPTYLGDYLSPRKFYNSRSAAMLVYQGFIHYAEIVEAGLGPGALDLALKINGGFPIPDNRLDLRAYTHFSEKTHDAREWAMLLAATGEVGAAGEAAAADLAMQNAESAIAEQLGNLIGKPAAARGAEMTVQGVGISGVRVTVENRQLTASYDTIVNVSRISGAGKRIQSAFEAGVTQAARDAGLTSARVAVETVINPVWKEYLLSIGYRPEMLELQKGVFSVVLSKVFPL